MTKKYTEEELKKLNEYRFMLAKTNIIDFACLMMPKYVPQKIHYLIADRLELLYAGKIKRMLLSVPPRIGKSTLSSVIAPVWAMANNPGESVIIATYAASLSEQFGSESRELIKTENFQKIFPHTFINPSSQAKVEWEMIHDDGKRSGFGKKSGKYINSSIGGSLTGKGASLALIIDDYCKDAQQAMSETYAENSWHWYVSTFSTRGNPIYRKNHLGHVTKDPNTPILILATRWAETDLIGKLKEKERVTRQDKEFAHLAENWVDLCLPAIAEEDEEYEIFNKEYQRRMGDTHFRRKKGDSIEPTLYPIAKLEKMRHNDPLWFAALFQGNPTIADGNIFKKSWWNFYTRGEEPASPFLTIQSWDLAATKSKSADFSAGFEAKIDWPDIYLTKLTHEKMVFPEIKKKIKERHEAIQSDVILIEHASAGIDIINEFKTTGLPIMAVKTAGESKVMRAISSTPTISARRVLLPKDEEMTALTIDQASKFPRGSGHDDIVDALTQLVRYVQDLMKNSYFTESITSDNKFPGFLPPHRWPTTRSIYIDPTTGNKAIIWMTFASGMDSIYGHRFEQNQPIIFCAHETEAPIETFTTQIRMIESSYKISPETTYINADVTKNNVLQTDMTKEFEIAKIYPIPMPINESIMAPLTRDTIGRASQKLIITSNCDKLYKGLIFTLRSTNYERAFAGGQDLKWPYAIMMAVSAWIHDSQKQEEEKKSEAEIKREQDRAEYYAIFGGPENRGNNSGSPI